MDPNGSVGHAMAVIINESMTLLKIGDKKIHTKLHPYEVLLCRLGQPKMHKQCLEML